MVEGEKAAGPIPTATAMPSSSSPIFDEEEEITEE